MSIYFISTILKRKINFLNITSSRNILLNWIRLTLQLGGYSRIVYLMDLALTTFSPNWASGPVRNSENFRTIGPDIWEEIANVHWRDRQIVNYSKILGGGGGGGSRVRVF